MQAATTTIKQRLVANKTFPSELSPDERAQLGSLRLRRNGVPSSHPYPPTQLWETIRGHLIRRSLLSNPQLDPELTAYTPGETLHLLSHPTIRAWHTSSVAKIPEKYKAIVLVPCAKTKPWTGEAIKHSKLYSAYNALREEFPNVCFVTISEPLGIVPMQNWADFPQYDNPGLFRDDSQRSGMTTKEWKASPFGKCYGLPFDQNSQTACIEKLGTVVGEFLSNNQGRRIISVVDNKIGAPSTHGEMLDIATQISGAVVERHAKRGQPRVSPLPYLYDIIRRL